MFPLFVPLFGYAKKKFAFSTFLYILFICQLLAACFFAYNSMYFSVVQHKTSEPLQKTKSQFAEFYEAYAIIFQNGLRINTSKNTHLKSENSISLLFLRVKSSYAGPEKNRKIFCKSYEKNTRFTLPATF